MRLFERLTHAQQRRERLEGDRSVIYHRAEPPYVVSIKAHLTRLLNTRRGSARIDPEYGLPSLAVGPANNSLADRQMIAALIRDVIARYETRAREVVVEIPPRAGDGTALDCDIRLRIKPGLAPAGADPWLVLRAQLMSDGTLVFP